MRSKRLVLTCLIVVSAVLGARFVFSRIYVPPILMYHSIDQRERATKLSLSPEGFARQMEFLYKRGYTVVSLAGMVDMIRSGRAVPFKTVAITFDDGYRNNFLSAYPILKLYGFSAAFFVKTDTIGTKGYVTWDDLLTMNANGMTIGSHTMSHPWLPDCTDEQLRAELTGSKRILERKLKTNIDFLAYPLGAYDARVQKAAQEAGYVAAVSTNPGPEKDWRDIYALKRVRISRTSNNMLTFFIESSGYYTFIKETRDEE